MPQTFYVTQDEEILSLVGRLRSSTLLENVFVVPNHALILQSAVNLRILHREAEKLGKVVTIVTQDETGRVLAEKAGIGTKPYSEEARQENAVNTPLKPNFPADASIGSSDFFPGGSQAAPVTHIKESALAVPAPIPLRVRDASPKKLTTLNSAREIAPAIAEDGMFRIDTRPETEEDAIAFPGGQAAMAPLYPPVRQPVMAPVAAPPVGTPIMSRQGPERRAPVAEQTPTGERLARMYRKNSTPPAAERRTAATDRRSSDSGDVRGKGGLWFLLFAGVSLLSLVSAGVFFLLPKAEITVVPHSLSKSLEIEFEGKKDGVSADREVPIRLIEREEEVAVSVETSGTSAGNGTKAQGTIIISNTYGSEPQQLIATTRFETGDGKVYRLSKGVTVPGVSDVDGKKEPGVIEAEVVADEPGESYNIGASSFSIPGFKGNPKYEKITGKSKDPMTGGSSEGDAGVKTVSSQDIERAKEESENTFRSMFEESLKGGMSREENFLPDSVEVSLVGSPAHPQAGVVASSFEYKARFKARAFVFSESVLKDNASLMLRRGAGLDDTYEIRDISLEYGEASSDFDRGIMYIKVRATALFASHIDIGTLRDDFLGKDTDGIKEVLERHAEVKKIEVNLKPKLFIVSVPNDPDRVTIVVEKP